MKNQWLVIFLIIFGTGAGFGVGFQAGRHYGENQNKLETSENAVLTQPQSTPIATPDSKTKIIGKWKYWGSKRDGAIPSIDLTVEYFEDETYNETSSGYNGENGSYIVLGGNRLKRTHEICDPTCRKIVNTQDISFPDQNTLYVHYSDESIDVYQRQ